MTTPTIPDDVARCAGVRKPDYSQKAPLINRHPECRDCLRRRAFQAADPHRMMVMMQPPPFADTCPYRIAP